MFKTKFKNLLITKPSADDSSRSKNIVQPATEIANKLAPAKFLKNLDSSVTKVSPPTMTSASESEAKKRLYAQTLDLSPYQDIVNTEYENTQLISDSFSAIGNLIPDIISLTDFIPGYVSMQGNETKSTSANDLLNIQIGLRQMSEDTVNRILNKLYDDLDLAEIVNEKRTTFTQNIDTAVKKLSIYSQLHGFISNYKNIIDFKNYRVSFKSSNQYKANYTFTVEEYFKQEYGYSDLAIKSFLNTKMILQFLQELYNSAKFYSYNSVISDKKVDRKSDRNHFSITKEGKIDISKGIVGSNQTALSYNTITSNLPFNKSDAIFLATLFLGREFKASAAINNQLFLNLLAASGIDYAGPDDDLFLKIIGAPFAVNFAMSVNDGSIVSGVKYATGTNEFVMPFENKLFVSQNSQQAVFTPGDSYAFANIMVPELSLAERTERLRTFESRTAFSLHRTLLKMVLGGFDYTSSTVKEEDFVSINEANGKPVIKNKGFDEISIFDEIVKSIKGIKVSSSPFSAAYGENKIFQGTIDQYIIALFNAARKDQSLKVKLEELFRPNFVPVSQGSPYFIKPSFNITGTNQQRLALIAEDIFKTTSGIPDFLKDAILSSTYQYEIKLFTDMFFNDSGYYGIKNSIIAKLYNSVQSILAAMLLAGAVDITTDNSIETKFRNVSRESIWSLVYETFFNIVTTLFSGINFELYNYTNQKKLGEIFQHFLINSYDGKPIKSLVENIDNIVVDPILNSDEQGTMVLKPNRILYDGVNKLRDVRNTLIENKVSLIKSLQILDFFEQFRSYINDINNFISNTDNLQFIRDTKQLIIDNTDKQSNTNVDLMHFNQQQIAVSRKRLGDFLDLINGTKLSLKWKNGKAVPSESTAPPIYKSDIGSSEYIKLFKTWLNTDYTAKTVDTNSKILTVGIPYSLSDNLKEKVELDDDTNLTGPIKDVGISKGELDIIKITVYKEDLEYEDIIFEPKQYIFELSRFVNRDAINSETALGKKIAGSKFYTNTNFKANPSDVRDTALTYDAAYPNQIPPVGNIGSEFNLDIKNQLNTNQLRELKTNHVNSDMLMLYIKLLIGADLQEVNFPAVDNIVYPVPDQDLLELFNLLGDEEDLQTWAQLFTTKTILTDGTRESLELLVPKKYERIFNILIDEYDFPIDKDTTEKALLETLEGQDLLEKRDGELYLSRQKLENISLERFYVKISTLTDVGTI